jgi:hypothetical protein
MKRVITVVLSTLLSLVFLGGVALANIPDLDIGQDIRTQPPANANRTQCVGVILDQDGVYNHMDSFGNGYDALLCTPQSARIDLGWGHTGGYYMGPGRCEQEEAWDGVNFNFVRTVCAPSNRSLTRFMSSNSIYRIKLVK